MLPQDVFMADFCLLHIMQSLFMLHLQLVIVLVARIRLLRILEVQVAQLKWREVIRSRSLCNPYVAIFDDPM